MVVADMEFAKKMLLVDPITYQRQQEYKEIQKSGALQVKADLSLDMKRIMNSDMPEDEKAKHYAQALERYRNVSSIIPSSVPAGPIKAAERQPVKHAAAKKKKKTKKRVLSTPLVKSRPLRRITRKKFSPSNWLTY